MSTNNATRNKASSTLMLQLDILTWSSGMASCEENCSTGQKGKNNNIKIREKAKKNGN